MKESKEFNKKCNNCRKIFEIVFKWSYYDELCEYCNYYYETIHNHHFCKKCIKVIKSKIADEEFDQT